MSLPDAVCACGHFESWHAVKGCLAGVMCPCPAMNAVQPTQEPYSWTDREFQRLVAIRGAVHFGYFNEGLPE